MINQTTDKIIDKGWMAYCPNTNEWDTSGEVEYDRPMDRDLIDGWEWRMVAIVPFNSLVSEPDEDKDFDPLYDTVFGKLVSEPVERKPTIITRPPKQGGESGEWKDGKFIPLVSEPVEDEIEITTRVYNRWSTEKYVDHFGIYEPFPLWLSNRRKDA